MPDRTLTGVGRKLESYSPESGSLKTTGAAGTSEDSPLVRGDRILLLIDGHAYAYRAFFAIRSLNSPDGRPTNAIYGFLKMTEKLRSIVSPTHVAVIWDGGLAKIRTEDLPDYKANRPTMPEELSQQIEAIGQYLAADGITSLCRDGVEADDWIGVAAKRAEQTGYTVVIASSDKDFMQLVSDRVGLYNPGDKSEKIWKSTDVEAKTGVKPGQIVDWLALIGDTVDNIPGVLGVGPKTASALLTQFGNCDALYSNLNQVASVRTREALKTAREAVERNRRLVRLPVELDVECDPDAWGKRRPDLQKLADLFGSWGFKSLHESVENRLIESRQTELL